MINNNQINKSLRWPAKGTGLPAVLLLTAVLSGCAVIEEPAKPIGAAQLTPATPSTRDLVTLPPPKSPIVTAVYGFRDQTGQYKPAPDSSFSTSVTQGAASMLIKALKDSGWYVPVERESLQELLTERRIVRALDGSQDNGEPPIYIPPLTPASIMVDGGIISYESNVKTGGAGARFLGIGLSTQYRVDQVTVSLRSVDIRSGEILQTVSTTKTIFSYEVRPSVFKFVNYNDLLEIEAGVTRNEPAQLCVKEAIEAAVIHLVVRGIKDGHWELARAEDINSKIIQDYLNANITYAIVPPGEEVSDDELEI